MRRVPFFLGWCILATAACAQDIIVELPERATTDDKGFHLEALMPEPGEYLILPDIDTVSARYLEVFYSHDLESTPIVSALVLPQEKGQLFYIDLNNDEDLTNDGDPVFFPYEENELTFYLNSTADPEQRTGRVLQRIPSFVLRDTALTEWFRQDYLDGEGNLSPQQVLLWGEHNPGMTGERHSYFFDDRLHVSRGVLKLDGEEYTIGVLDYNENGRFDDVTNAEFPMFADLLMIDLGRDGELSTTSTTELFKLNDVFEVAGKRFKLGHVDPYGRNITLVPTEEPTTSYYLAEREKAIEEGGGVLRGQLNDEFWDVRMKDTDGNELRMSELRGRHILLNFWGEWCAPCIAEIPALVAAREEWDEEKLFMIGMLYTENIEAAEALVEEKGMNWPQVPLTPEVQEQFKVQGYPTNILILPDGKTFIQAVTVSTAFFDRYVQ